LARRVFEIAKDLGVNSKAIVAKCQAEGIPNIQNHMSTVSVGLEATIREWFERVTGEGGGPAVDDASASASHPHTAVETAAPVDLEAARAKPKARAKARTAGSGGADGGGTAVAEPPTTVVAPAPARPAEVQAPASPAVSRPATPPATPAPAAPAPAAAPAAPVATPSPAPTVAPKQAPAPTTVPGAGQSTGAGSPPTSSPAPAAPAAPGHATPMRPRVEPPAQPASGGGAPAKETLRPAATTVSPTEPAAPSRGDRSGGGSSGGPSAPAGPLGPHAGRPGFSPRMNVPDRPKFVGPVGQKLETQTPAKLSGPRVVRVEAAEVIDVPRPRRPMGGGEPSMPTRQVRGGSGAGPGSGPGGPPMSDEERNRRNKRRAGPGAGPAGRAPAPGGSKRTGRSETDTAEWSAKDLIEREERLNRSEGFLRQRRREQKLKDGSRQPGQPAGPTEDRITIAAPFTIKDLSSATGLKAAEIVKRLFMKGIMATANSGIDPAQAQEIMMDFDIELVVTEAKSADDAVAEEFGQREVTESRPRSPVVTILGHVDHGKTSLLDKIRNTNIAAGEAGGITQSTRAFRVPVMVEGEQKWLTFLDTPGHEAFSEMRARGANMTDVVVLVVSAVDGVMPQTLESIKHAQAAKVPVVVALNKIDVPGITDSQIQQIFGKLAEQNLSPVEWGGNTEVVRTSATQGTGITQLLEVLDLQAQLLELKADFKGHARGTVIEARQVEGRGSTAQILVQDGELKVGDIVVCGRAFGRVRDITDDTGKKVPSAGPSMPVLISGLDELPNAGDKFFVVDNLRKAQDAAEQRRQKERERELAQPKVTLDNMFDSLRDADVKELLLVIKADVQGSVDVIKHAVEKVSTDAVKVRVLMAAAGGITESDVNLAAASRAVIMGFNVIASGKARQLSEQRRVEIRSYQVIYDIVDDVKQAAEGLLAPEVRLEVLGHADVRQVFKVSKVGSIAGCYVTDGAIERNALIRVTRGGIVIENDRVLEQLKRFKDDAKDVKAGMECGMKIVGYDDIKVGDVLECYKKVEVKRTL
jgi:translation initiation factor IF-2